MPLPLRQHDALGLADRIRDADAVTTDLISSVIQTACRRFPSVGQVGKTTRIERLIASEAWTDAALALIDLELPQWQVRRIAYDGGEWHCALSRARDLPEWLDQSIEAYHNDLPLAILGAFVAARQVTAPSDKTSVPTVRRDVAGLYEPACCDNFA
jgi:hypothetical protein